MARLYPSLFVTLNDLADVDVPSPTDQFLLYWDDATSLWKCKELTVSDIPTAIKTLGIIFAIDNGGSVITTGLKMGYVIPFACTITQATTLGVLPADTAGSIVFDIWKTTYAGAPPLNANSITASAPPTITAAKKSQDSTLTGWIIAVTAGDVLFCNVDSCSTFTAASLTLQVERV
jgi:hypothetical protein